MTVHEHILLAVSAQIDRELDADRSFLTDCHLEGCGDCLAAAAAMRRVDALAREALLPVGPAPFERQLAARIAATPAGTVPALPPARPVDQPPPAAATPGRAAGRRPAPAARPGARPARRSRLRRRLGLSVLAAMLALAALVGGAIVLPSLNPTAPPQRFVAAAEVLARAERAAAGIRTLQGSFTHTGGDPEFTGTFKFVYAHPDRLRVEAVGGEHPALRIHDGPNARWVRQPVGETEIYVTEGTPLARPQAPDVLEPLGEGFGWYGAALTGPERRADPVTRDGQEVYVLLLQREPTFEEITGPAAFTHYEVWVDADSYLPVRVRHLDRRGAGDPVVVEETRFDYERVNGRVPAGAFAVPRGAVGGDDRGFVPMPLDQARSRAGYGAPELAELPGQGWRLLRSGYAPVGEPTGAEGSNPPGRDLVVAVYGLGLDRLTLTSLLVTDDDLVAEGIGAVPYNDPFRGEGARRATRQHRLAGGAFAGTRATIGLPTDRPPYLWFRTKEGVVVTLSGTVTVEQLVAAAEALRR